MSDLTRGLTEQELKTMFGKVFRRDNVDYECYVILVTPEALGSGYGVVPKSIDPDNAYYVEDVRQYLIDYPEMECQGWLAPYTPEQEELIDIRTRLVECNGAYLKSNFYSDQLYKFKNDDIWEGSDTSNALIVFEGKNYTCDQASLLITQYAGDDDVKVQTLLSLRNQAKNYIRTLCDTFISNHYQQPEFPVFDRTYVK